MSRDVYGLFGEVNIPIITGLETNLALRYDDYENVGSKTTGKIGVRYQPNRTILLRSAYGTGFRAPSLLDLYAPQTTGVTPAGPERSAALRRHRLDDRLRDAVPDHQRRQSEPQARDVEELHRRHRAGADQPGLGRRSTTSTSS